MTMAGRWPMSPQLHREGTPHPDPRPAATINLDLVEAGHAAPFVIYPSVPGELDLPLLLEAASAAVGAPRGYLGEPRDLVGL
jgi:hypothetical protein